MHALDIQQNHSDALSQDPTGKFEKVSSVSSITYEQITGHCR